MKVLLINSVCGIRSTGRICTDIADILKQNVNECKVAFGRGFVPEPYLPISLRISHNINNRIDWIQSRVFGHAGFHSKRKTKQFLNWIDNFRPDLIHIHNIHGYYLNAKLLFQYIKQKKIPVIWTLHDCWSFTGHCTNFSDIDCNKWKIQCEDCPLIRAYPKSFRDTSYDDFLKKKELFMGVQNMTIVTPSEWLANQVQHSFLSEYRTIVIPNGIDLNLFRPTAIRDVNLISKMKGKKIVLGVSTAWSEKKGLSKYYQLAELLGSSYQVILVGLTKRQCKKLPSTVLGIQRTNNIEKLASLYTAANCVVSLSMEETMGMTILEGNACGTPAVVFNKTALPELITPQTGIVVDTCTIEAMCEAIVDAVENKEYSVNELRSHVQKYEKKYSYGRYIELYYQVLGGKP